MYTTSSRASTLGGGGWAGICLGGGSFGGGGGAGSGVDGGADGGRPCSSFFTQAGNVFQIRSSPSFVWKPASKLR